MLMGARFIKLGGLAILSCALSSAGCVGDSPQGGTLPPLKPGTVLLLSGATSAPPDGLGNGMVRDELAVHDVARDGTRIVVMLGGQRLVISEDLGATWTVHSLTPADDFQRDSSTGSAWGTFIVASGGRIWLLSRRRYTNGTSEYSRLQIDEIDLASETYGGSYEVPWDGSLAANGHVLVDLAGRPDDEKQPKYTFYTSHATDLTTGVTTDGSLVDPTVDSRGIGFYLPVGGGASWVHYASGSFNGSTQTCRFEVTGAASLALDFRCVDRFSWPRVGTGLLFETARGEVDLLSERGHVLGLQIVPLSPAIVPGTIDLGPGEIPTEVSAMLHPRTADLVPIIERDAADGSFVDARFMRIPAAGDPEVVPLSRTPCQDDAACGDFAVQWVLPTVTDEFLVFYTIATSPAGEVYVPGIGTVDGAGYQSHLLVRREKAPPEAPSYTPLPPYNPSFPQYPTATPGSMLELVCARADMCLPSPNPLTACVGDWMKVQAPGVAWPAYDAFLATMPGCAAFEETFPSLYCGWTQSCSPGCYGDVSVNGFTPPFIVNWCGYNGQTCAMNGGQPGCVAPPCNTQCDAAGRVVTCNAGGLVDDCAAKGEACVSAHGEAVCAAHCPPGMTSFCDGSLLTYCEGPGGAPTLWSDCSRSGLGCDDSKGCVDIVEGACPEHPFCEGDVLLYCFGGNARFVDCASLGAHCSPSLYDSHCAM